MDFLREHQLNIMLFLSGICGILAVLVLIPKSLSRRSRAARRVPVHGALLHV